MKRLWFMFAVLVISGTAWAQDVLVTKDGDALKVWGLEVSSTSIYFRESEAQDASIKRMDKKDVLLIKYKDGRKVIIGEEDAQPASPAKPAGSVVSQANDAEDIEANRKQLNDLRNNKVNFVDTPSNKDAGAVFCQYFPKSSSIMADKNISFSVVTEPTSLNKNRCGFRDTNVFAVVKNHTNKIMYVDLGSTFFVRGGQSYAFYVPTATSNSTGVSTGIGVNVGSVLGNVVGSVGLGSTSSKSVTTTTIAQRVIAVPPMSEKRIEAPKKLFDYTENDLYDAGLRWSSFNCDLVLSLNNADILKLGECREIGEDFKVGAFSVVVTYSDSESIVSPKTLNADFSVNRIMGIKAAGYVVYLDCLSKNLSESTYFIAKQKKKK